MKKSSKGALAAAAGAALLLGGAGSLAYWSDQATVPGGAINTGKLTLTDDTTGGCAASPWILDDAEAPAGAVFVAASDTLVPGDVLTKKCRYVVGAAGAHLRAAVSATGGAASGALSPALSVAASFTIDSAAASSITSADDGKVLEATISLTFAPASGNSTQLSSAVLSDYVVTAQQVHD